MVDDSTPLPSTLAECHAWMREMAAAYASLQAVNAQQQATIEQQQETVDQQQTLLESLQRDLALLKRSMFGRRRERFEDPDQLLLFDSVEVGEAGNNDREVGNDNRDEPDSTVDEKPAGHRRGRVRRVLPECLPRVQRVRKLEESEIPQDLRGRPARRFLKKVAEWVEWQPPQLQVIEEFLETLAVDNEDATETRMFSAPRQPRILNSFAGPSLLAGLAVNRFADHQPYYRLEEILQRSQLTIDRGTQCRWMIRLAEKLSPLVELMRRLALQSPVAQADETSVKLLVPGQGHASTAYLWAVLGDRRRPYTTFYFTKDRTRAGPDKFFADFRGVLLCDAYVCYESLSARSQGTIRLAGCHAHARRKFEELHVLGPTHQTSTALGYFQRLFDLEDELRDLTAEDRHAQRQLRARPLLGEFKDWLDEQLDSLRPKHPLRGAIAYMTKRWECFSRFLESGAIPIHNNATEQAVKVAVIGKKNWLFFGSPRGGETAAVFYTLTATCRRLQINPQAYLKDVFERLPLCDANDAATLMPLLPDRWLADHPESRLQLRATEAEDKAARKRAHRTRRRKALAQIQRKQR
jgi:transposase